MLLLNLPSEIFQRIVHELVLDIRPHAAWELRRVCRTFASEIYYEIFTYQPKESFYSLMDKQILLKDAQLYLFNRTKMLLDVDEALPNRINEMVNYLDQELGLKDKDKTGEYTKKICNSLIQGTRNPNKILRVLWPDMFDKCIFVDRDRKELKEPMTIQAKLIAAAAVDAHNLIRTLLPQLVDTAKYSVFESPLNNAVIRGNEDTVRVFLDWCKTPSLEDFTTNPTTRCYGLSICRAIVDAIAQKKLDILQQIINFLGRYCPPPYKHEYNWWLRLAIESRDIKIVELILGARLLSHTRVTKDNFMYACDVGKANIIRTLIEKGRIDPSKKWTHTSPLVIAVKCGHVEAVRAVLDAGADIDGKIRSYGIQTSALQWAVRCKDEDIVKLLLSRGAELPELAKWPKAQKWRSLFRQEEAKRKDNDAN